jgi:hypothetical protein
MLFENFPIDMEFSEERNRNHQTSFVCVSADWTLARITQELRSGPADAVLVERKEEWQTQPYRYLYPYSFLLGLLQAIEEDPDRAWRIVEELMPIFQKPNQPVKSKLKAEAGVAKTLASGTRSISMKSEKCR